MLCIYFIDVHVYLNRRLGGESDREISMAPACVILSLGLWSCISPPGAGRAPFSVFARLVAMCKGFKEKP